MSERQFISVFLFILLATVFLVSPGTCSVESGETTISISFHEVLITADISVLNTGGYTVNGNHNLEKVIVSPTDFIVIDIPSLPVGMELKAVVDYDGEFELVGHPITLAGFPRDDTLRITIHLSLVGTPVEDDNGAGGDDGSNPNPQSPIAPNIPSDPDIPEIIPSEPELPEQPENPDTPDTPGSDEPGSDEPYLPILPPAGSVYNLAGFIPLGAGALLLFLVFFWRRKVYRILKSHAKKYGEKPEKEHLKEIADAIIKLVRDEGRYPEWKKNSDVAKRLSADIVSVLDEMNYPKIVPRGALVAEILKAARGRINRHRL